MPQLSKLNVQLLSTRKTILNPFFSLFKIHERDISFHINFFFRPILGSNSERGKNALRYFKSTHFSVLLNENHGKWLWWRRFILPFKIYNFNIPNSICCENTKLYRFRRFSCNARTQSKRTGSLKLQTINFRFSFFERRFAIQQMFFVSPVWGIQIFDNNYCIKSFPRRRRKWLRKYSQEFKCIRIFWMLRSQLRAIEKHFRLIGCIIYSMEYS